MFLFNLGVSYFDFYPLTLSSQLFKSYFNFKFCFAVSKDCLSAPSDLKFTFLFFFLGIFYEMDRDFLFCCWVLFG